MNHQPNHQRNADIEIQPETFRTLGHQLVDQVADFLEQLPEVPVAHDKSHHQLRQILAERPIPEEGTDPAILLEEATELLFNHSTQIGHPRFLGYIIGAPSPIGAFADFLAAIVNQNVGAWVISPMATEIETQSIRWLAELIGYPSDCGGVLVSGGNMANFIPFVVARYAKTPWNVREHGMLAGEGQQLRVYVSNQTHTWIQKAADLFGYGTDAIRWLETDNDMRIDVGLLRQQIETDKAQGDLPIMVVGTAGTTAVGAVDPLPEIADVCREYDLWFHIDGAYGAPAAVVDNARAEFAAIPEADSIALDPHKWLYAPLEAGAVLVRDRQLMVDAFAYHPDYYPDMAEEIDYHEYGLQNSRGFRALKVWLGLRQVGKSGYKKMIAEDIHLAQTLYELADAHEMLEAFTHSLSVTTFRYVPNDLDSTSEETANYLNELNKALVEHLQSSPDLFLSNAILNGTYALRTCIVNFRTSMADIQALPDIIVTLGQELDAKIRPQSLKV